MEATHTLYVNLKISRGIGLLAKLGHFVPKNTLRTLYYAIIQPTTCRLWFDKFGDVLIKLH